MRFAVGLGLCLLVGVASACTSDVGGIDSGIPRDSGPRVDAGRDRDGGIGRDAGELIDTGVTNDAGVVMDADVLDADVLDAQPTDAQPTDAQPSDAQPTDAQPTDAQPFDAGAPADAGQADAQPIDAGAADAAFPDAAVPRDGGTRDAGPRDGGPDAGMPVTCDIVVDPPETNAGQVGSNGGSPGPNLACPAGDEIIGIAVRISDNNTSNGGQSAVGFTIICASVTIDASGPTVGTESVSEVMGTGQFGWTPATQSSLTRCPAGWVMSGLSASRGSTNNRFLEVTLTCSELLATGATSGATQDIYVMGSATENGQFDVVACAAGQVVRRLDSRVGAGLDAVSLLCATPACRP